jgi:hypothetical protein
MVEKNPKAKALGSKKEHHTATGQKPVAILMRKCLLTTPTQL